MYTTMEKEKMREQKLISLIEKQKESEFVDFKQEFYHKEATQDLIKDVISFANAQSNEEKYIIFGVSDTYNLFDIAYEKIRDISELNQVIKEYCEPFINVEFYRFIYEEKKLLALIIAKNVDRPYLIKKDYQKNGTVMLRAGDIYIRHGATNFKANRADLDFIYANREKILLIVENKLLNLIQEDNFIGWVYSINYEKALIITNDEWKLKVKGIPHNSFLVATSFNPKKFTEADEADQQVILFRVNGSCKLPQDDDMIRTKIDGFQKQKAIFREGEDEDYDIFTKNKMQFSGLECRVLGTFYIKNEDLVLGSDIETFYTSLKLNVYMPTGKALEQIVNYIDPIRKRSSKSEFKALGIQEEVDPFKIGTVRYTSTDRLHRADETNLVPFTIQPSDFLARRTAVLGMTRTGKSNMIKQTISVVKGISQKCNLPIGQLIYDINGEYANTNEQDKGAIADIYKDDCIRYRMINSDGFKPLLNNFYEQLEDGHQVICDVINENSSSSASDVVQFMNITFDMPEDINEKKSGRGRLLCIKFCYMLLIFSQAMDKKSILRQMKKLGV